METNLLTAIDTKLTQLHTLIGGGENPGRGSISERLNRLEGALFSGSGNGVVISSAAIAEVLRSTNFVTGSTGWQIEKSGAVEFEEAIIRGTIYASGGEISGTLYVGTSGNRIIIDGSAKIIKSENYSAGVAGWQVSYDGSAEFNDVTVRGAIYASSGEITGAVYVGAAGDRIVIDGVNKLVKSENYSAGVSGWQISYDGTAEFQNVVVRGYIETSVFQYNQLNATAGTQMVVVHAGNLLNDVTVPASPATCNVDIQGTKEGVSINIASVSDILRIKDGANDTWLEVQSSSDEGTYYRYVCVILNGSETTYTAGNAVVNYGQSGDGGILLSADQANGPFIKVFSHAGAPWATLTERVRIGNLNGWGGFTSDLYGLAIGSYSDGSYMYFDPSLPTPNMKVVNGGGAITMDIEGLMLRGGENDEEQIRWTSDGTVSGTLYGAIKFWTSTGTTYGWLWANGDAVSMIAAGPSGAGRASVNAQGHAAGGGSWVTLNATSSIDCLIANNSLLKIWATYIETDVDIVLDTGCTQIRGTGSVYPNLGTTTTSHKMGNFYQGPDKDIFPNNEGMGYAARKINPAGLTSWTAHFRPSETTGPGNGTLTGYSWAGAPFVTPANTDWSYLNDFARLYHAGGGTRGFLYASGSGLGSYHYIRLVTANGCNCGLRMDDGTDNNYYEVRLVHSAGANVTLRLRENVGGAGPTNVDVTGYSPDGSVILVLRSYNAGGGNHRCYAYLLTEAATTIGLSSGALVNWTPSRKGLVTDSTGPMQCDWFNIV